MNTLVLYYSCSGHTKVVAECIAENLKCDIQEIRTKISYNTISSYTIGLAHTYSGHLPELSGEIEISEYDTIYIGGPVWNYTVCPVLKSFFKRYDLTDKIIIPFCSDGGSCGNYFDIHHELAKGAKIKNGMEFSHVNKRNPEPVRQKVNNWLHTM